MKFSTPFTLLAMTLISNTDARIGDGGHRNLIDYSKLKKCDPNQNRTVTPECLSEGKGYACTNIELGSRNGDYRCLDRSQSTPTVAPSTPPTNAASFITIVVSVVIVVSVGVAIISTLIFYYCLPSLLLKGNQI